MSEQTLFKVDGATEHQVSTKSEDHQRFFFANGYGASVIRDEQFQGPRPQRFELAVLTGNAGRHRITYDTTITNDVLCGLTRNEVEQVLQAIQSLPKATP